MMFHAGHRIALCCFLLLLIVPLLAADNLADVFWEAHVLYKRKQYLPAARLYEGIIQKGFDDPDAIYDAAGSFALAGNSDKAFYYLGLMCKSDFRDVEGFLADADFDGLKKDKRWQRAVEPCRMAEEKYLSHCNKRAYDLELKSRKNPALAVTYEAEIIKLVSSKQLHTSCDYFAQRAFSHLRVTPRL